MDINRSKCPVVKAIISQANASCGLPCIKLWICTTYLSNCLPIIPRTNRFSRLGSRVLCRSSTAMAPIPNGPPMRQSCDKCYRQKLRCTRTDNGNTGACDRCVRQRTQCAYSSSLPKGRPSIYRPNDDSASTAGAADAVGAETEPATPVSLVSSMPATPVPSRPQTAGPDGQDNGTVASEKTNQNSSTDDDLVLEAMNPAGGMCPGTWPWLQSLNWEDAQINWDNHDMDNVNLDWNATGNVVSGVSAFGKPGSSSSATENVLGGHGHGFASGTPETNNILGGNASIPDAQEPGTAIAQLSQLSLRLASLHRSSYALVSTAGSSFRQLDGRKPLLDDAAFESITSWLARGSANTSPLIPVDPEGHGTSPAPETRGKDGILHDVFSASQHLLEILRLLQTSSGNTTPATSVVPSLGPSTATSTPIAGAFDDSNSYFGQAQGPSASAPGSGQRSSGSVVRHLVSACHTLLLNIYSAVLAALEHDARPGAHSDTAALGAIRLVSVLQLCSYLIERQHQAVELYMSPQSPLQWVALSRELDPFLFQAGRPGSGPDDSTLIRDLKMEVQQKLARLQRTLCG